MEHYRAQLEHIVRPENPTERDRAESVTLDDYEALYLYRGLAEYAAYGASSTVEEQIALGYCEYIDYVVREEGETTVTLYAHTEDAATVLVDSVDAITSFVDDLHSDVQQQVFSVKDD